MRYVDANVNDTLFRQPEMSSIPIGIPNHTIQIVNSDSEFPNGNFTNIGPM